MRHRRFRRGARGEYLLHEVPVSSTSCLEPDNIPEMAAQKSIHPEVRVGHVHLKVSDLDQAIVFYRDVLGFEVTQRMGQQAAFLSAGGYHHHVGLNTWESEGGAPAPKNSTGLYHAAFVYPTRRALAEALQRVLEADIDLQGAADHGVSEAVYLQDPDGNGIELYWDRPDSEWPRSEDGTISMYTRRLDVEALLATLEDSESDPQEI